MTTGISPSAEIFLNNLQQIQNRISAAQQQLSSGYKVNVAADAPDQISSILALRAQIAGVQQTQENLANVTPQVSSGGSAIQQAIQVLDTATTLATEASGSTSSAAQRLDLVPQVTGLLQQLVSLSQTSVNGQYIFSGDQSQQPSYQMNAAGDGVDQVIVPAPGAPGQVMDSNGVPISIGLTAAQIFDHRDASGNALPDNVFAAVTGLINALNSNSSGGIQTALNNLGAASDHLNNESSFYGAAQNNIQNANSTAAGTLAQLQQQLSNAQDADAAEAAVNLQSAMTAEQAALAGQAEFKPQSLFNYLS